MSQTERTRYVQFGHPVDLGLTWQNTYFLNAWISNFTFSLLTFIPLSEVYFDLCQLIERFLKFRLKKNNWTENTKRNGETANLKGWL